MIFGLFLYILGFYHRDGFILGVLTHKPKYALANFGFLKCMNKKICERIECLNIQRVVFFHQVEIGLKLALKCLSLWIAKIC